jgi:hypothetical protein
VHRAHQHPVRERDETEVERGEEVRIHHRRGRFYGDLRL